MLPRLAARSLTALTTFAAACLFAVPSYAVPSPAPAEEPAGRKYALLVGVSEYKSSAELRALPGAEHDVTHLRQTLIKGGYKAEDVTLLTCRGGSKPTGANIRAALKSLTEKCKPEDTVVLAFAGHGIQLKDAQQSFCPYDAVWDNADTLIPLLTVFEEVGKCKAKRKLLLVDACRVDPRAETEGEDEKKDGKKEAAVSGDVTVPAGNDLVAIFSCKKGQVAYEDVRLRHGVFFHYVICGLAGEAADADGVVTLDALVAYVRQNTVKHVKREFDADQEPRVFQNGETGVFPILQVAASNEAQTLLRSALVAAGNGDTEAAMKAYTRVIEVDKKNADAYLGRGLLLKAEAKEIKEDQEKRAAKYDEAIGDFDRALRYKPDLVAAYHARAEVRYQKSDYAGAVRDFDTVLELDDEGPEALTGRSYMYYWMNNLDKAAADAEQALKLNPDYARAYYVRALTRLAGPQPETGLADLDKAVSIDPLSIEYRKYRQDLAIAQGDAERVAKDQTRLEQVAAYVPRSDLNAQQTILTQQVNVGDFYQTNGYTEQAEQTFRRANNRAEFVNNGLQKPNQQKEWNDRVNRIQERPGQNTEKPPGLFGGKKDPADKPAPKGLAALLAPKVQEKPEKLPGLFGGNKPPVEPKQPGGLFGGNKPPVEPKQPGGLFGGNKPPVEPKQPIFGGNKPNPVPPPKSNPIIPKSNPVPPPKKGGK